jgi:Ca-activated chloride channel family protein
MTPRPPEGASHGRSRWLRFVPAALCVATLTVHVTPGADLWVHITAPRSDAFVLGTVEIVAEVIGATTAAEVAFYVDGRAVGVLTDAPYRLEVDLGEENIPHRFTVVATDADGNQARATVETEPVPIARDFEVELQQLYVTATANGRRVLDLKPDEFVINDNDEEQELVTFANGDLPFIAALLIDASASMHGEKLEHATAGAAAFVRGMQRLDQAKVLVYSHQILNTTPFTSNHNVLITALGGALASGGTALHDHLYAALKLLEQRQGRRVVILLSDGVDTHSVLDMEQTFDKARHSQALIYWIRLTRQSGGMAPDEPGIKLQSAWRSADEYRDQFSLLQRVVEDSGGRIIRVERPEEIQRVFVQILQELREQYVLGYYPSDQKNNGSWHRVRVKVKRRGVDVRAHEGYVDL